MIRLGRISYVNMAPVFYRLEHEVEEVTGVPTDLNARLWTGSSTWRRSRRSNGRGTPIACGSCRGSASAPRERSTRSSSSQEPLDRFGGGRHPESATSVVLTRS